jgi:hypothetical protein
MIGSSTLVSGKHFRAMARQRHDQQHSHRQEQQTDPKLFLQTHTFLFPKIAVMDALINPAAIC